MANKNKTFLMELDVCIHEGWEVMQEMQKALKDNNCFAYMEKEFGPAGGNSLWFVIGTKQNLQNILTNWYMKEDTSDVEYYMTLIKEFNL